MTTAKNFETRLYEPGQIIIAQGSAGGHLAYIMEGQVEVVRQGAGGVTHLVATLGPGDILGEMAILTGQPRNATARAAVRTRIIQICERTLQLGLVNEHIPVLKDMVTQLARRLQEMEAQNREYLVRIEELEREQGTGQ